MQSQVRIEDPSHSFVRRRPNIRGPIGSGYAEPRSWGSYKIGMLAPTLMRLLMKV